MNPQEINQLLSGLKLRLSQLQPRLSSFDITIDSRNLFHGEHSEVIEKVQEFVDREASRITDDALRQEFEAIGAFTRNFSNITSDTINEALSSIGITFRQMQTAEEARAIPQLRGVISTEPNFAAQGPSIAGETIEEQERLFRMANVSIPESTEAFWQLHIPTGGDAQLTSEITSYLEDTFGFVQGQNYRISDPLNRVIVKGQDREIIERMTALVQRRFGTRLPEADFAEGILRPVGNLGINFRIAGDTARPDYTGLDRGIPTFGGRSEEGMRRSLQGILKNPEQRRVYYGDAPAADVFPNVRQYLRLPDLETTETFRSRINSRFISLKSGRAVPIMENQSPRVLGGVGRARDAEIESILRIEHNLSQYTGSTIQGITGEMDFTQVPFEISRALRDRFEEITGFRRWFNSGRVGLQWINDPMEASRPFARMRTNLLDILGASDFNDAAYNIWASTNYLELDPGGLVGEAIDYMKMTRNRPTTEGIYRLFGQVSDPEQMNKARIVTVVDTETTGLAAEDGIWQFTMKKYDTVTNRIIDSKTYHLRHPRLTYGKVPTGGGQTEDYIDFLTRTIREQTGTAPVWDEKTIPQILDELVTNFDGDAFIAHNAGFDIQQVLKWVSQPGVDPALRDRVVKFFTTKASKGAIYDTRRLTQLMADTIGLDVDSALLNAGRGATPVSLQNIVLKTDLIERMRAAGELSEESFQAVLRGHFHDADLDAEVTYGLFKRIQQMASLRGDINVDPVAMRAAGQYDEFSEIVHNRILSTRNGGFREYLMSGRAGPLPSAPQSGMAVVDHVNQIAENIASSSANVPIGTKLPSGLTAFEHMVIGQRSEAVRLTRPTMGMDELFSEGFSILNELERMGFSRNHRVLGEQHLGFQSFAGFMPNQSELAELRKRAVASGYQYANLSLPEMQATAALGRLPVSGVTDSIEPLNKVQLGLGERLGLGSFGASQELEIIGKNQNIVKMPQQILEAAMQDNVLRNWEQAGLALDHFTKIGADTAGTKTTKAVALKYMFEGQEQEGLLRWLESALQNPDQLERLNVTREQLAAFTSQARRSGLSSGVQVGVNWNADELHDFIASLGPKSENDFIPWMTRYMGMEGENIVTSGAYIKTGATRRITQGLDEVGRSMVALRRDAVDAVIGQRVLPRLMTSSGSPMDPITRAANSSAAQGPISAAAGQVRNIMQRTIDESVYRGVEESYKKFKGKAPLLMAGAAAAALGYYVFRRKRWEQTYNATLEMQPFEDERPSAPDPVIAFGSGSRMSPMATSALVDNLYQNRVGHSNMAPDRHKYLFGSGY